MRNEIKKAIGETIEDLIASGINTSFSEKELNSTGNNESTGYSIYQRTYKIKPKCICQIVECKHFFSKTMGTGKEETDRIHQSVIRIITKTANNS